MIALIAAISKNNCIGKNNKLLWDIKEDMKRFRKLTTGKTVLMGRKTWESLPAKFRPLPNRKNIVVTRNKNYKVPRDVDIYESIKDAINSNNEKDIFVIGGAQIYSQTIDLADKLYITHVKKFFDGDTFFPEINPKKWTLIEKEDFDDFCFCTYRKI